MPSKDTLLCLSYRQDVHAFAKLSETNTRVILALLTEDGFHLSLHRSPASSETHVEYSSRHPIGSVWDAARVGIAEKLGYKQPQKHACYILNAPLRGANPSETPILSHRLTLDSFSRSIPARRARLPRICIPVFESEKRERYYGSIEYALHFEAPWMEAGCSGGPVITSGGGVAAVLIQDFTTASDTSQEDVPKAFGRATSVYPIVDTFRSPFEYLKYGTPINAA